MPMQSDLDAEARSDTIVTWAPVIVVMFHDGKPFVCYFVGRYPQTRQLIGPSIPIHNISIVNQSGESSGCE